jgi:hypothetical protein
MAGPTSKFDKVKSFFENLGREIHAGMAAVFGQPALDSVEATMKTILTDDVRVVFEDAINLAESTGGTGPGKRAAAFAKIETDLVAKGIALTHSAINLGIELVVGLMKAKEPHTAA